MDIENNYTTVSNLSIGVLCSNSSMKFMKIVFLHNYTKLISSPPFMYWLEESFNSQAQDFTICKWSCPQVHPKVTCCLPQLEAFGCFISCFALVPPCLLSWGSPKIFTMLSCSKRLLGGFNSLDCHGYLSSARFQLPFTTF